MSSDTNSGGSARGTAPGSSSGSGSGGGGGGGNQTDRSTTGNTANSGEKRLTDEQVKQLTDSANAAKRKRGRPAS